MENALGRWNRARGYHESMPLDQQNDTEYQIGRDDRTNREYHFRETARQNAEFFNDVDGYSWVTD